MSASYNHIIIGAGSAGLQLMLALLNDPDRSGESILILDPDDKTKNDRTWCYWEKGSGLYDEIVFKEWDKGKFISRKMNIDLAMEDYRYKMIRGLDFYNYAREKAEANSYVTWLQEKVESVEEGNLVRTKDSTYHGQIVYDSRVTDDYRKDNNSVSIAQHFLGWIIKTPKPVFAGDSFTMMDYRENKPENCSFTYILPFDAHTALVEFTFFSAEILSNEEYTELLDNYIRLMVSTDYEILEEESGVIPMTNYPFEQGNRENYLKIGTGGGWVKPSTGYSFRNSQRYIEKLLQNIRDCRPLDEPLISPRHRFFDTIFLKVLRDHNDKGEALFERLYNGLPTKLVFRFLDEESTVWEDFQIMLLYPELKFVKSFFSALKSKLF